MKNILDVKLLLVCLGLLISLAPFSVKADPPSDPVMAIIIDDIGDNRAKGMAAINLPGAITYAFLPHTPHSFELAETAHLLGKEVILHAPMENKQGLRLGPGALEQHHSSHQLRSILTTGLDSIPHVSGMNNHMGSLLTEDRSKMADVMAVAKKRGLFFIDSVTTSNTVAWQVARENGIPYLTRDVFLDNEQRWQYIHGQFKQALKLAVQQGHAVLIGHPYPETVRYLSEALPILDQLGIRLVTASELLKIRTDTKLMLVDKQVHETCDSYEGHCQSAPMAVR